MTWLMSPCVYSFFLLAFLADILPPTHIMTPGGSVLDSGLFSHSYTVISHPTIYSHHDVPPLVTFWVHISQLYFLECKPEYARHT